MVAPRGSPASLQVTEPDVTRWTTSLIRRGGGGPPALRAGNPQDHPLRPSYAWRRLEDERWDDGRGKPGLPATLALTRSWGRSAARRGSASRCTGTARNGAAGAPRWAAPGAASDGGGGLRRAPQPWPRNPGARCLRARSRPLRPRPSPASHAT